jgi:hypothetical protein
MVEGKQEQYFGPSPITHYPSYEPINVTFT